ncbi:MAG: hypothetical protein GXO73_01010 [Calditrichaeota bacterium]|nr:hypothetical protein [Calditrichota bacterium]
MPVPLSSIVSIISGLLPLSVGLVFFRRLGKDMRLLVLLLTLGFALDVASIPMAILKISNIWLINLYFLVDYALLAFVLSYWQDHPRVRQIFRISVVPVVAVWAASQAALGSLVHFNFLARTLECILLSLAAIYTLWQIGLTSTNVPLARDYRFWVALSILIYFSGTIFLYAFGFLINTKLMGAAWVIHSGLNVTANLGYTGGFLCFRRP